MVTCRAFPIRRAVCALFATGLAVTLAPPALASETADPFEAPRDRASYARALQCLTQTIYYEARSEPEAGQRAVAQVVLNRVRHPSYPNSVCGVVYQGSTRRTGCQFTFTCDGSLARGVTESAAWDRAERVAEAALRGNVFRPAGLALNYHTTAIRPYWAPSLARHAVIGSHIFYNRPDSRRSAAFDQAPSAVEPRPGQAVNFVARAPQRQAAARPVRSDYQPARVEIARVERPRVERPTIERPASSRTARMPFGPPTSSRVAASRRSVAAAPPAATRPQAPAASRRGPRTSVENGVRVARGS